MKKFFSLVFCLLFLAALAPAVIAAGFDEFGYNRAARVFVGTGIDWCMGKLKQSAEYCANYMDPNGNDQLVMKWNKEWDRGNTENWSKPPYDASEDNEWNGAFPGGSGSVWHYKIVWVGTCGADGAPLSDGGYCIWGQFEVILSQGTDEGVHIWDTHADPAGYGAYYKLPTP